MIVAVQGTKDFGDYNIFLRSMSVALSSMNEDDKHFIIYSMGPAKINSFVSEFSNLSERGMKARGMKIKFYKVDSSWLVENINTINYFAFLCKPNQPHSRLVAEAQMQGIETGIFSY